MYARNVSFRLKSNMRSDYALIFENQILPLLRKQIGLKEEITLANPDSLDVVAISLWANKADAETYNINTYPEVLNALANVIDGTAKIQAFEVVTSTSHNVPLDMLTLL